MTDSDTPRESHPMSAPPDDWLHGEIELTAFVLANPDCDVRAVLRGFAELVVANTAASLPSVVSGVPHPEALKKIQIAREAVTTLRDAVREGRAIDHFRRDPLVSAIHDVIDMAASTPPIAPSVEGLDYVQFDALLERAQAMNDRAKGEITDAADDRLIDAVDALVTAVRIFRSTPRVGEPQEK